ncbi:uncharacterized protein LOC107624170 isoform X2 [Arachis ipaensis]|uniref:uncharacterized protein LOC107624170 isoform X2 n=1 Tax=Arachis ipaensis TaxID=130454 RepID=UPI0007AFBBF7|nr:uncharacterized protein LOC107624170 isoform X2 [Arachis ipaensis]
MVVKMMRWRPWPPLVARKYEVRLVVRKLEGCDLLQFDSQESPRLTVEIRWKGPKLTLGSLRRTPLSRNFTREADILDTARTLAQWDEEFHTVCTFNVNKDNAFHPWEIALTLFNGLNQGPKSKVPVLGTALLNIAEFASLADQKDFDLSIPLTIPGVSTESSPSLCISVSLVELRSAQESADVVQRSVVPLSSPSTQSGETNLTEKDELSAIKAGLRKVKIFTEYVSSRKEKIAKTACNELEGSESRCSRSEDYPMDSDSLDDFEEGESDERKEASSFRKSFSYESLAYANAGVNCEDESCIYYSYRKSDDGCSQMEDSTMCSSEPYLSQMSKRSILPWRKRKLSFRSPKGHKGEPLLKKAYAEEGGDDIDFDRRQLSSDESFSLRLYKTEDDSCANCSSVSEFGDDNFAVGSWEQKEVLSRDGHMKLQTQVFFASIDQRSERAAGESACTALVAVIADWFQNNHDLMPIKSQFDSLIREGSSEWRKLCDSETYRERFPDKHFDLETVIQAKIRPLSVVPGKSFIGFFHPEGMDEERFDFLHGAMSFDNIWDEITRVGEECPSNGEPQVYIVSWNDHFFILKVEDDAYYIIDTLGERLYEGCNQAYILKFDSNTLIYKMHDAEKPKGEQQIVEAKELLCKGKEACKAYIKNFLAAIPIRELQADLKKGLLSSTPLHHRLQLEFNYTQLVQSHAATETSSMATPDTLTSTSAVETTSSVETLSMAATTETLALVVTETPEAFALPEIQEYETLTLTVTDVTMQS